MKYKYYNLSMKILLIILNLNLFSMSFFKKSNYNNYYQWESCSSLD